MFLLLVSGPYETPDAIKAFNDIGGLAVAAAAIAGIVIGIGKIATWLDRKREDRFVEKVRQVVEPLIKDATKPIQPDTNGGKSLSDLHVRLNGYDGRFSAIEAKLGIKERRDPSEDIELPDFT